MCTLVFAHALRIGLLYQCYSLLVIGVKFVLGMRCASVVSATTPPTAVVDGNMVGGGKPTFTTIYYSEQLR